MKALKACNEGEMPTIFALATGEVKTAITKWQDRLSSVSWLLRLAFNLLEPEVDGVGEDEVL